ncbi:HK97 family phage prohead protease [Priestia aryabhattai]|uniref:HK97 family phage prohead protease n=1 Tax=Bacilli TaxID=91061 RepID=UPI002DB996C1|nr:MULTISPECIES: HK97 family phage prohead protease [Bacilli]MEC0099600.1 HK97 family phage prohead protease [Bacillus anthracis]MED3950397.1 HK97 family phage prohead protease [Priestia aryabhattai]MED4272536.1 HK97 family phage prohead protease [Weissella confusa]
MTEVEYRAVELDSSELRSGQADDGIGQIAGYAIVWDTPSTNLPFTEVIKAGALDGVDLSSVLALYNHDFANVLGRVDAGTLKLNVDDHGLHFVLNIPDTTLGHDVYTQIKNGNLKGLSFRFTIAADGEDWKNVNGEPVRYISKIATMREISIVSVPAYDDTSVEVTRSFKEFTEAQNYKDKVLATLPTYEIDIG